MLPNISTITKLWWFNNIQTNTW